MADLLKCKNCGGELALSSDHSYYECKYCEARFPVEKKETPEKSVDTSKNTQEQPETVEKPQPQLSIVQKHLRINNLEFNDESESAKWNDFCRYLNADIDIQTGYYEIFEKCAAKDFSFADSKSHKDLYSKAYIRVAPQMSSGEQFLICADGGIFVNNAKKGIAYTNKAFYFVEKKAVYKLPFEEIRSITYVKGYHGWQFNNSGHYHILSLSAVAIFLVYVCKMAISLNPADYTIDISSKDW